jgi:hypothetical protein
MQTQTSEYDRTFAVAKHEWKTGVKTGEENSIGVLSIDFRA